MVTGNDLWRYDGWRDATIEYAKQVLRRVELQMPDGMFIDDEHPAGISHCDMVGITVAGKIVALTWPRRNIDASSLEKEFCARELIETDDIRRGGYSRLPIGMKATDRHGKCTVGTGKLHHRISDYNSIVSGRGHLEWVVIAAIQFSKDPEDKHNEGS